MIYSKGRRGFAQKLHFTILTSKRIEFIYWLLLSLQSYINDNKMPLLTVRAAKNRNKKK